MASKAKNQISDTMKQLELSLNEWEEISASTLSAKSPTHITNKISKVQTKSQKLIKKLKKQIYELSL